VKTSTLHILRDLEVFPIRPTKGLTAQMDLAAANLEFEKAAELRDVIAELKKNLL